jgi:hypothetical protein
MKYATLKTFIVFAAAALSVAAATLGHTQQAIAIGGSQSTSITCINDVCHVYSSSDSPSTSDSMKVAAGDVKELIKERAAANDNLHDSLSLFD